MAEISEEYGFWGSDFHNGECDPMHGSWDGCDWLCPQKGFVKGDVNKDGIFNMFDMNEDNSGWIQEPRRITF